MIPSMSISISTTIATEMLKNLTTSNVIQLMNRQSYMWGLIKYHTMNTDFTQITGRHLGILFMFTYSF